MTLMLYANVSLLNHELAHLFWMERVFHHQAGPVPRSSDSRCISVLNTLWVSLSSGRQPSGTRTLVPQTSPDMSPLNRTLLLYHTAC